MVTPINLVLSIDSWKKKCSILKTFRVMKIKIDVKCFAKVDKCVKCIFASTEDRTLVFFQKTIDNNKSIEVTIYRCQIQAIKKKRLTFEVFKLIYFKKPPIKKVLIKLSVLSDASVLLKSCFFKQAPQKVFKMHPSWIINILFFASLALLIL